MSDCDSVTRLQRRDTPHHLKNKRLNAAPHQPTTPPDHEGQEAECGERVVRRLLARQIVDKLCEETFDEQHSADEARSHAATAADYSPATLYYDTHTHTDQRADTLHAAVCFSTDSPLKLSFVCV